MFYEPKNGHGLARDPIKACVVPRPIGWISTISIDGIHNLAPFSYSNLVGSEPPMFMFSANGAHLDGGVKDSALNARETGEFVYNLATWETRDEMNSTSLHVNRGMDEFDLSGLTKVDSIIVTPPRVAESPISFECKTWKLIDLPAATTGAHNVMVIGEVVGVHITDDALKEKGYVDVTLLRPLARLGYLDYSVVDDVFTMARPK
ncbi:MAG: flavin reductase [Rhodospirillaceae bacterium]|nr:flavin reductase [Rhodospirillaceae bacterium]|tara:strand:- start:616 stop:1230 length:615 start_codon:yes stop_codon:yes gene_type:complete